MSATVSTIVRKTPGLFYLQLKMKKNKLIVLGTQIFGPAKENLNFTVLQFARLPTRINCTAAMTNKTLIMPDGNERCNALISWFSSPSDVNALSPGILTVSSFHKLPGNCRQASGRFTVWKLGRFLPGELLMVGFGMQNANWRAKYSTNLKWMSLRSVWAPQRKVRSPLFSCWLHATPHCFVFPPRCHSFWLAHARHVTSKMAPS